MKILITGATGFLGRNLIARLQKSKIDDLILYKTNSTTTREELKLYTKDCDFVFNFAAVHRPQNEEEFTQVNHNLFVFLLQSLQLNGNACPVVYTSSIQATNGSAYGLSKIAAEDALLLHVKKMNSDGIVYRLTNIFGRWARPNAHSVVATFCYNINRGIPIKISDRAHQMYFYYIDDVIDSFIKKIFDKGSRGKRVYCDLSQDLIYPITLGELADKLIYFKKCQEENSVPELSTTFERKLYDTYQAYCEGT